MRVACFKILKATQALPTKLVEMIEQPANKNVKKNL